MYRRQIDTRQFIREVNQHRLWQASNHREGHEADFTDTLIHYDVSVLPESKQDSSTSLIGLNFNGASFSGSNIRNLDFINCSFQNTDFSDCYMRDCEFKGCDFSTERNLGFKCSQLDNVTFLDGKFVNVSFFNTQINNSFISDCDFTNSNLNSSFTSFSTFYRNSFKDASIVNFKAGKDTTFSSCDFVDCNFSYSSLCNVNFDSSNIQGGYITKCSLNGSNMVGIPFKDVEIIDTNVEETKLSPDALPWLHKDYIHIDLANRYSFRIPYDMNKTTGRISSEILIGPGKTSSLEDFGKDIHSGKLIDVCIKKLFPNAKFNILSTLYTRNAIKSDLTTAYKSMKAILKIYKDKQNQNHNEK